MAASVDLDVFCPRCRYNLRGLPEPRCPECGLTFTPEMWTSGVLREHIPTWLDKCDPWQPHQVLIRSLYELFHGALRPRWVLTKLDLNGPLWPAVLMLVFGTVWLYVLITTFVAVATLLHTGASPYAALKSAALSWAPRVLVLMLPTAIMSCGMVTSRRCLRVMQLNWHQYFRCASYWVLSVGVYILVPLIALVVSPDFALYVPRSWVVVSGAIPCVIAVSTEPAERRRVPVAFRERLLLQITIAAWIAGAVMLGSLLPDSLDPPWWVYF